MSTEHTSLTQKLNSNFETQKLNSNFQTQKRKIIPLEKDEFDKSFPHSKSFSLKQLKDILDIQFGKFSSRRCSTNPITVTFPNATCLVFEHTAYKQGSYDRVSDTLKKNKT